MPLARGGGAERNAIPPYAFAGLAGALRTAGPMGRRRSSALRSLGAFANVFAAESFVDEIAAASGHDPLAWRLAHLQHDPAGAAGAAGSGPAWPAGAARPAARAAVRAWATPATRTPAPGAPWWPRSKRRRYLRVHRLCIAVDVGLAVNPDGVRQQIEGGAVQAISWT
jgi:nicotinate dehydrogenase subunit B